MNIKIHNPEIHDLFLKGDVIFKIQSTTTSGDGDNSVVKDLYMVTEYEDVLKKIKTHQYTPLLYLVPFTTKLSYLYGCLNYEYNQKKTEKYVFYWRTIGTQNWDKWFTVLPYNDTMF